MIERNSTGAPFPPEPPVRRPRAFLILLVVALPFVMGAVFFFRWDVLDPRYWSLDGIAVLAKFSEIDLDLPPEYVSDWGAADLKPPRPEQLKLARLLRAGDHEALAAVSREVVLGFNDTSPELEGPLDAWVEAMPGSATARMARGVYWRQIGWHRRGGRSGKEKGLALYRTFVDGPGGGFFLDDFAKVLKRTGRRSEALAYHVRAANHDPDLLADDENYPELLIRLRH